ncbi:RNA 2',3'-cyclic phosphodiesterase [Bacillus sp. FJAT-27445]|uniref:RNA 2',3'-cyclic phosphodiesterase n=1 Tax=Bacillus sp. FJAT-27445 TaxID=1679166 RepID=UPI000AB8C5B2|nr:RNA 2',3'-cyclic phosphodiesterase [Bacillus sp. FJAT-27445]
MSHYFFAARIPEETKLAMKNRIEELKRLHPFRRWVHHEDLHITLAFLGNAPEAKLEKASQLVESAIQGMKAFSLELTGLGTFGQKDSPRVFWAGLLNSVELGELRNRVFTNCEEAGFQLEKRPFAPHVTLARNWEGNGPFNQKFLADQPLDLGFLLEEVVVYRTNMEKTPKYESVKQFRLNG